MKVVLLCATRRGYRVVEKVAAWVPPGGLVVFSFPEEPWEPPFLRDIEELTLRHGGTFFEGRDVGAERFRTFWETTEVDLMLTVNWRYLVPASVFRLPRRGSFVFHDSMLPEYRGFSPTVWAMVNGKNSTGVTLFEMEDEVDSGRIVDQERVPIGPDETIAEVTERVTGSYLTLLDRNFTRLADGTAPRQAQDRSSATFTCRRTPEDNGIDWSAPTDTIYDLIRAVTSPYPGAFTTLEGRRVVVWAAERVDALAFVGRVPGRVVEVRPGRGAVVLTGDGALLLTRVQVDGDEARSAAEVLKSTRMTLGR